MGKIKRIGMSLVITGTTVALLFLAPPKAFISYVWASGNSSVGSSTPQITEEQVANQLQAARDAAAAAVLEQRNEELKEFTDMGKVPENQTVNGIKTNVDGLYYAKSVDGISLMKSGDDPDTSSAYTTTWDVTPKKSPDAYAALSALADVGGFEMGPMFQINLGTKTDKGIDYSDNTSMMDANIGIPKDFYDPEYQYVLLEVRSDGSYEVIFPSTAMQGSAMNADLYYGQAAYALARYPKTEVNAARSAKGLHYRMGENKYNWGE